MVRADWKGIAIGLNAAFLNIATEWLSDIKLGYCTTAFYLNENFCCSGAESGMCSRKLEASLMPVGCPEFKQWTGFLPFNYVLYIVFAVSSRQARSCADLPDALRLHRGAPC
jgi:chloride channel 3/4/5